MEHIVNVCVLVEIGLQDESVRARNMLIARLVSQHIRPNGKCNWFKVEHDFWRLCNPRWSTLSRSQLAVAYYSYRR